MTAIAPCNGNSQRCHAMLSGMFFDILADMAAGLAIGLYLADCDFDDARSIILVIVYHLVAAAAKSASIIRFFRPASLEKAALM